MKQTLSQVVGAAAAIALGMIPDIAEAQGPPPDPARRAELVKRFDADGNGVLSPEEIKAAHAARSGQRPKAEFDGRHPAHKAVGTQASTAGNEEMIERLLRRFDRDGNGRLSFAEMDALRAFMETQSSHKDRANNAVAPSPERAGPAPHHPPAKAGGEAHE